MTDIHEFNDLLYRWNRGQLNDQEVKIFNDLLRNDPELREALLHETALKRAVNVKRSVKISYLSFSQIRWIAAAVLVFAVLLVSMLPDEKYLPGDVLIFSSRMESITLGQGRIEIDGSPQSKIQIEENAERVEILLMEGGIRNAVIPQSGPYRVKTESGFIDVIGTEFSVELLEQEREMDIRPFLVKVLSGAVFVSGAWGSFSLSAGEEEVFPKSHEQDDNISEEDQILSQEVSVHFKQTYLKDVIAFFEQVTGVSFVVDAEIINVRPDIMTSLVNLNLNKPLKHVLQALSWQLDLPDFIYTNEVIYLPGEEFKRSKMQMYRLLNRSVNLSDFKERIHNLIMGLPDYNADEFRISAFNDSIIVTAYRNQHKAIDSIVSMINSDSLPLNQVKEGLKFENGRWIPTRYISKDSLDHTADVKSNGDSLFDVIGFLSAQTGVDYIWHQDINNADLPPISLSVTDMKLKMLMEFISTLAGVSWQVHNDIVYVGFEENMNPTIQAYQISGNSQDVEGIFEALIVHAASITKDNIVWMFIHENTIILNTDRQTHEKFSETLKQYHELNKE